MRVSRNSAMLAASIAFLMLLAVCQTALRDLSAGATIYVPLPPAYAGLSVDARIVRRLLGIRILVADLLWIDAMIKSDIAKAEHDFSDFYRVFKTIVTLDPDNLYVFWVGGLYLSVIKDDIKGATALLRDGVNRIEEKPELKATWKGAWQLPFTLGYNLLFEEQEFEAGASYIRKAAEFPDIPGHVKDLGKRVSTEQGVLEVASRVLSDIYQRVDTVEEKAKIEAKMLDVAVKQELLDLNAKFKQYLSSTGAYALPKKKAFTLFMRSLGHPKKDMRGITLEVNELGIIAPSSK